MTVGQTVFRILDPIASLLADLQLGTALAQMYTTAWPKPFNARPQSNTNRCGDDRAKGLMDAPIEAEM
jgi:hypothetical protein